MPCEWKKEVEEVICLSARERNNGARASAAFVYGSKLTYPFGALVAEFGLQLCEGLDALDRPRRHPTSERRTPEITRRSGATFSFLISRVVKAIMAPFGA